MKKNCYISNTIESLKKLKEILEKIDKIKELHPLDIDFSEFQILKDEVKIIQGGLECSFNEINSIYNDISSFEDEIEIYKDLKDSEDAIKEYGYDFHHEGFSGGSCYVSIIDKVSQETLFKIRISDHELSEKNYLPAGVINDYSISKITAVWLELFFLQLSKMSEKDKKYLWENRLISELRPNIETIKN